MTLGKDLSPLFQSVIKCLEYQDLDIKKLVVRITNAGVPVHHQLLASQARWCHHVDQLVPQGCSQQSQPHHQSLGSPYHEFVESAQTERVFGWATEGGSQWRGPVRAQDCSAECAQDVRNRAWRSVDAQPGQLVGDTRDQIAQCLGLGQLHRILGINQNPVVLMLLWFSGR